MCKCYTCHAEYQWKDPKGRMQAGHFISQRDCPPLIFDENNVRPQCNVCNSIGQGMQYFYGIALANEKGQEEVDRLFRDRQKYKEWKKHNPKKSHNWQRDWLNNKIAKYDAETKRLKGLY